MCVCVCVCAVSTLIGSWYTNCLSFSGDSDSKESACNAGDLGSVPGLGRSPGEGNGSHSSIIAWRIPWTEELGELQSMGSQSWTKLSN